MNTGLRFVCVLLGLGTGLSGAFAKPELSEKPVLTIEVIPLRALDVLRTLDTLQNMFGDKGPFLAADAGRNALILRGTREQIAEAKAALRLLGEGAEASGSLRIFILKRGHATVLAEAVADLLPKMRANPIRVVLPSQPDKPSKPAKEAKPAPADAKPVTLTAVGNRIIAVSDDAQALALVKELIDVLTATDTGEGDFEVMRLRHANGVGVAKVLSELFNGRAGPARQAEERVRIVADPATNSLLVKAATIDLLMIRQLLRNTLDSDSADSPQPPTRVRLIPLKNARAEEVAKVLRDVYREMERSITITFDVRTNNLVIRCSPVMEADINDMVRELDAKEK